MYMVMIW